MGRGGGVGECQGNRVFQYLPYYKNIFLVEGRYTLLNIIRSEVYTKLCHLQSVSNLCDRFTSSTKVSFFPPIVVVAVLWLSVSSDSSAYHWDDLEGAFELCPCNLAIGLLLEPKTCAN